MDLGLSNSKFPAEANGGLKAMKALCVDGSWVTPKVASPGAVEAIARAAAGLRG